MKLERPQIIALVVLGLVAVVAFFPDLASRGAKTLIGLVLLVAIFGVIPELWKSRRR